MIGAWSELDTRHEVEIQRIAQEKGIFEAVKEQGRRRKATIDAKVNLQAIIAVIRELGRGKQLRP